MNRFDLLIGYLLVYLIWIWILMLFGIVLFGFVSYPFRSEKSIERPINLLNLKSQELLHDTTT